MSVLTSDSLCVGYNNPLISDICLNIKRGTITTLLGANGSGKSTILKTISGHLKRLGGNICFDGINGDNLSEKDKAKKLSVMLTERIDAELMTCRDVVETGRYPYTGYFGLLSDNDRRAVKRAVELVEIENIAECDFSKVSDGQRQRVMLARAICQETDILLLDEPTSYLDIHHKILFLETLQKLAHENHTAVILSMHELDLAEKISDYVICVKDGKIAHYGNPEDIFKQSIICGLFDISDDIFNKYLN